MSENKNKQILKIFNKIRQQSVIEYDDINPDEYISVPHFIRLFSLYNHNNTSHNKELPKLVKNKHGYGYIVLPPSRLYNNMDSYIYALSNNMAKIEKNVRGWIIDLRGNDGGSVYCFMLFILIFVDINYEGLLCSIIKGNNDIVADYSFYNNSLILRNKYEQMPTVINIKNELHRTSNNKNIKILVDKFTGSGSEYVCLVLKSFGAKIYGTDDKTYGLLNLTAGYLLDDSITLYFPNAFVYDKNNLKHNIYIDSTKNIKPDFLLP
jgi:C-terminal processing protease CtpA/Prc